jgi:nicotinate-nucleotide adenylyltransferase
MICIFGGTFDPVHFGHLRPALEVQQALQIDRIDLLPCRIPPHREPPQGSPEQRLELLRLAVVDEPALAVDAREFDRKGPSYMVDTLTALRAERGAESVCLALGMDALLGLESWHRWREIAKLCHLVVMQRPGGRWPQQGAIAELLGSARTSELGRLQDRPAGCVFQVPVTQMAVSSTQIRDLLAAGKSPRYLLPDAVLNRIKQENWYAS